MNLSHNFIFHFRKCITVEHGSRRSTEYWHRDHLTEHRRSRSPPEHVQRWLKYGSEFTEYHPHDPEFAVTNQTTVGELKRMIEKRQHLEEIDLCYKGKILDDQDVLSRATDSKVQVIER